MIDVEDPETVAAIRLLYDSVGLTSKPVVVWVGAGASCWVGYPTWGALADALHSDFNRHCAAYDSIRGAGLISTTDFPAFFQHCRNTDVRMYQSALTRFLAPRPSTPVYGRFIDALAAFHPLQIVTTNVDELLEQNVPGTFATIQRSDAERAHHLSSTGEAFIFKVHGTISDFDSMVFTADDFSRVSEDVRQLDFLRKIIARSTVIFIGYGLRDDHVIRLLREADDVAEMFGDGPHFALLTEGDPSLPASVKTIKYQPDPHREHRAPIRVLEELGRSADQTSAPSSSSGADSGPPKLESAHFLFDLYPHGTWKTSSMLSLKKEDGSELQAVVGPGFTDEEVRGSIPDAVHDLLVGLICFEKVYASTDSVGRLHTLLGSENFWRLVKEDCLRFLHWKSVLSIMFPGKDATTGGHLESWSAFKPDMSPITPETLIRRQITAAPGKTEVGEAQIEDLASRVHEIDFDPKGYISGQVRSLLLRPSVQDLLGFSGGTPLNSLTRWNMFSVLRLGNVVQVGGACRALGISSAKIAFGAARLAGPAFATTFGVATCDDAASYVVVGRYGASLGQAVLDDPNLMSAVLRFRETQTAGNLRAEVLAALAVRAGADVVTAINGGLSHAISPRILREAQDEFVGLLLPTGQGSVVTPAIWNDSRYESEMLGRWRARSLRTLEAHCREAGIGPYDWCPCGSGEKLKFCCQESLSK